MIRILTESSIFFNWEIKKIEEHYNATYLLESCLKNKDGGWCNFPVAIFYQDEPHPHGSNYFALYRHPVTNRLTISNGISAVEEEIPALMIDDTVIYSKYRHNFVEHAGVFIDGGRDYVRVGGERIADTKQVNIKITGKEICII